MTRKIDRNARIEPVKFVKWDVEEANFLTEGDILTIYETHDRFHSQASNLVFSGVYRSLGWQYRPSCLRKFYFSHYGRPMVGYAPNKTLLRRMVYGAIKDIVEI